MAGNGVLLWMLVLATCVSLVLLQLLALYTVHLLHDDHINTYHARLRLRLIDQLQVPIFIVGLVLSVIQSDWVTLAVYVGGVSYHYYKHFERPRRQEERVGSPSKDCYVSTHIALRNSKVVHAVQHEYMTRTLILVALFIFRALCMSVQAADALLYHAHDLLSRTATQHVEKVITSVAGALPA